MPCQTSDDEGILNRAVRQLFEIIDELNENIRVMVCVSFLEIYNEEIRDLLHPEIDPKVITNTLTCPRLYNTSRCSKDVFLREDGDGIISVIGIPDEFVTSPEDVMNFVSMGTHRRTTAQTLMNDMSSRSHAVFTVQLHLWMPGSKEQQVTQVLRSKLQLVDLAGSERQKRTGAHGVRLKESVGINQGLLSLGKVIAALTSTKVRTPHIPYRDSKLTRLLQVNTRASGLVMMK